MVVPFYIYIDPWWAIYPYIILYYPYHLKKPWKMNPEPRDNRSLAELSGKLLGVVHGDVSQRHPVRVPPHEAWSWGTRRKGREDTAILRYVRYA